MDIAIKKELKDLIVPLGNEEYRQLEKNVLNQGCLEPLYVWGREGEKDILIDGHNRFRICKENKIEFKTIKLSFSDIEEVKLWMLEHQLGRRNLTPDQMSYYRGMKYLRLRKSKGGYDNVRLKGKSNLTTSERLAEEFKVSESTIKRDSKYAEALNLIATSNQKLKNQILSGEVKIKKSDLQTLLQSKDSERMIIHNEYDLKHKIHVLKEGILSQIESEVKLIEEKNNEKALEMMAEKEPLFQKQEDRLKKLKGRIISSINEAINNRDLDALRQLKTHIERLEVELNMESQ